MSSMMGISAHLVVGEDDIHTPVKTVLDMPVLADGGSETGGVRGKAGNIETSFGAALAFEEAGDSMTAKDFRSGQRSGQCKPSSCPKA
jgi:hypothetical protein